MNTQINPDDFKISRKPHGKGFSYFFEENSLVTCRKLKGRIKALAIPPMWEQVKISENDLSHIQAIGYDKKGRRQYIYHEAWVEQRQAEKFQKLLDFSYCLTKARRSYLHYLQKQEWSYEKACSLALAILDETGLRIGNEQYLKDNGTYGLSTLRRKHVKEDEDGLALHFQGKHGVERYVQIDDKDLARIVRDSADKPGYSLLRYKSRGKWFDLCSDDINDFVHQIIGENYSSKDFRTWKGTTLALQLSGKAASIVHADKRKTFMPTLIKEVACILGNTPAICKKYYIHPLVLNYLESKFEKGKIDELPREENLATKELSELEQLIQSILKQAL